MTAKFENANKKELNFNFIKLRKQLQLYFMKSVQYKKIKILVTEALTKIKIQVLRERISLNQCVMIRENLNNNVMIRIF